MADWFEEYFGKNISKNDDSQWQEFKQQTKALNKKDRNISNNDMHLEMNIEHSYSLPSIKTAEFQLFDRKIKRKISSQNKQIEAIIDLHGYSIAEAEKAIIGFIRKNYERGSEVVLIITGKGSKQDGNTIKQSLPTILQHESIKPIIISYTEAAKHHGGTGAYYLRLRRKR